MTLCAYIQPMIYAESTNPVTAVNYDAFQPSFSVNTVNVIFFTQVGELQLLQSSIYSSSAEYFLIFFRLLSSSILNCFLFQRVHKHRTIEAFSTPISLPVLSAALGKARTISELNDIKSIPWFVNAVIIFPYMYESLKVLLTHRL